MFIHTLATTQERCQLDVVDRHQGLTDSVSKRWSYSVDDYMYAIDSLCDYISEKGIHLWIKFVSGQASGMNETLTSKNPSVEQE